MEDSQWKRGETRIAIAGDDGKWTFKTFPNWDMARDAVNAARSEGKAAVIYDGSSLPEPPNLQDVTEL